MKEKILLVNQRYGLEVNGGSELLCRQLAELFTEHYEVEVVTTCALDYQKWENYYKPGVEELNGVTVRRFEVEALRDQGAFDEMGVKVLGNPDHTMEEAEEWVRAQGPVCDAAVQFILEHHKEYKAVLFTTYLYYLSAMGLQKKMDNAYLMPTAHDEPPVYVKFYRKVFQNPVGMVYNTLEEKEFVEEEFQVEDIPSIVTGAGVELPDMEHLPDVRGKFGLDTDYILYIGRIDVGKNCPALFEYFTKYKKQNVNDVKLVLAGKPVISIPESPDIISVGFVSDEEKFALIQECKALVLASEFESLSMVVLESMALKKPVLLNGNCAVLKGHCIKSNGGLYFTDFPEFEATLNYLLLHPDICEKMGENGKNYVDENYQWPVILRKFYDLFDGKIS